MGVPPLETTPTSRRVGVIFILGSAFCFSTMGTIVKDAYEHGATPTGLIALRMGTAALIWVVILNRSLLDIPWKSPAVRRLAVGSLLGILVASLAEYGAYRYLPVAVVVVILFMSPAWVALGQWVVTKRGIGLTGIGGLVILGIGLVLLTDVAFQDVPIAGLALALTASVGMASFFLLAGDSIPQIGVVRSSAVVALSSASIGVPLALLNGTLIDSMTSFPIAVRGASLGLVALVISIILLLNGLRRLGAFSASVVSATEPVFAGLLAWWFLSEVLSLGQVLGAVLVIAGTLVVEVGQRLGGQKVTVVAGR